MKHSGRPGIRHASLLGGAVIVVALAVGSYLWLSEKKAPKYTGPVTKLTLAAYAGATAALVYVAEEQGYFKYYGLDVTIKDYETGKLAAGAIINREADISTSAAFVFVSNSFDNPDLKIFGTVSTFETKELVARKDKLITTKSNLKGKKIGVTKGSGAEFSLATFLTFNGLSYKDVVLVDLKPSEIVSELVAGNIDAGFTWDPNVYNIKQKLGVNTISWPGESDFYFVLIAKNDWLKNNHAAAERFIEAVLKAEDYIKDNSEESKGFVKDRFDYESDYMDYSWPKQEYTVILSQSMIISLEYQARWRIKNGLTNATKIPNYLEYIYIDALESVKPEAVTIIR